MNLALKVLVLATSGSALVAGGALTDTQKTVEARCLRGGEDVMLATTTRGWRRLVKEVNVMVSQAPAATVAWRTHSNVHVVFANGGWVEFTPDVAAIASDSLPPLTAMRFAPAVNLKSARCEAP